VLRRDEANYVPEAVPVPHFWQVATSVLVAGQQLWVDAHVALDTAAPDQGDHISAIAHEIPRKIRPSIRDNGRTPLKR
jgi:hypothetical protein